MLKQVDRFRLEELIMNCWSITDDLQFVLDESQDDDTMNMLIGLQTLYNKKFKQLFEVFETLVHEGKIK